MSPARIEKVMLQQMTAVALINIAHSVSPEPTTRVDPREELLERSIGAAKIALLRELGLCNGLIQAMPQVPSCNILTGEEDPAVMAMETDILLTLDSGCCDHIVDMVDAHGGLSLHHRRAITMLANCRSEG